MEQLTVHIDVNTPRGRRLARELHGMRGVTIDDPSPAAISGKRTYTLEECYDSALSILKQHYGVE